MPFLLWIGFLTTINAFDTFGLSVCLWYKLRLDLCFIVINCVASLRMSSYLCAVVVAWWRMRESMFEMVVTLFLVASILMKHFYSLIVYGARWIVPLFIFWGYMLPLIQCIQEVGVMLGIKYCKTCIMFAMLVYYYV